MKQIRYLNYNSTEETILAAFYEECQCTYVYVAQTLALFIHSSSHMESSLIKPCMHGYQVCFQGSAVDWLAQIN